MSIMKKIHSISHFRGSLFGLAAVLLLASCSEDEITYNAGQQPDKGALETVVGTLRSSKSLRDRVPMHVVESDAEKDADKIYFRLNSAAPQDVTVTAAPDLSLVDEYNAANKTSLKPLPAANVTIANNGRITVPAGARISDKVEIAFSADGLEPGIYLLPVVLDDGAKAADQRQVLYYGLTVRKFDKNIIQSGDDTFDAELDTEWTTVFYVNTSEVQAHYADYVAWEKQDIDSFEIVYRASLGNIINLRIAQVGYDAASKRAVFTPTTDLRYTLEHADKYIRPMQDKGRKICVCIEGGGSGLGFCNMNDAQIADFVEQAKAFVETYKLDGVNLWDRGSGYGKEGMPEVNTTSYPRLIKALREAMPDKMLSVVDYEKPTESFYDTSLTGGIAVGDYIDYAWHGYVSSDKPIVFADPWNEWSSFPQEYPRKAFAGLDQSRYGTVNVPFYPENTELFTDNEDLSLWQMNAIMWGLERSNNIIVFDDLALPAAVTFETGCIGMIGMYYACLMYDADFNSPFTYNVMERIPMTYRGDAVKSYNTFAKDW